MRRRSRCGRTWIAGCASTSARSSSPALVTKPAPAVVAYVGALGAFSTTWLPPRPGLYELWAQYQHNSPGLFSDGTCVQAFRVSSR
jgi:hypothetical protein